MNKNIYFLGGIHGVGKGTLSKKLSHLFDIRPLSASEVLKWNDFSSEKNKTVKNFNTTQERLLYNLDRVTSPKKSYLLDGHFTLLNAEEIPKKIDSCTFYSINPKAIIVITGNVNEISERLMKRDGKLYPPTLLDKMQELEVEHASKISENLKIPIIITNHNNISVITKFLKENANFN